MALLIELSEILPAPAYAETAPSTTPIQWDPATIEKYSHNPCDPYYGSVCQHDDQVNNLVGGIIFFGVPLIGLVIATIFVVAIFRIMWRLGSRA